MIRSIAIALLVCAECANAQNVPPQPTSCTRNEAIAAEFIVDFLTTWDNVHQFYLQYGHCMDGAISEGVHDQVQRLWATRWSTLPRMISFTAKDEAFKEFVWRALQTEAFPRDVFEKVLAQSKEQCPPEALEFCQAVIAEARKVQ